MKILYINSLYPPLVKGGAELSLQLIVEGMQSLGHEVVVASLHPEQTLITDRVNRVRVIRVPLKNAYWPYRDVKTSALSRLSWHIRDRRNAAMGKVLGQIIKKERPDLVSCHNLAGWSVAAWDEAEAAGIPIVQVLHDFYLLCPNSNMNRGGTPCEKQCLSCQVLRSGHAHASAKLSAVVGISQSILSRFGSYGYFPKAKKQVIYNIRSVSAAQAPKLREPGQKLTVGYLGTISRVKGVEWLIRQFQELEIPASLKIAGKGHEHTVSTLRGLAKKGDVEFVGYVQPQQFLSQLDVLVVPSLWEEPLGMVAIEALAGAVPVVTSGKGGLSESVQHELNGLICPPEQPESLGQSLRRLYEDTELYNRLSAAAPASVAHFLDKNRLISEYDQIYRSVSLSTSPTV
ncbi:glycosyltransferase family 4 protein [Algoriphagus sp. H41]|uniref:Glycosyltransferase family 4 protein n=1 Tax=Algoriphagus oliviformis TaxID=2811231 RepID=A0ABS3BZI1_9BACT|nr:glycosyltransferase family 4 protein [Algoriphagus oliviformis]MBN7809335.1 glycosyltransferase family 4 protein [Algoriphagus oliviformis]